MAKSWIGVVMLAVVLAAGGLAMYMGYKDVANMLFGASLGLLGPQPLRKEAGDAPAK